ncbi:MAG: polysaccharide deacetylase family protein [Pseudomonadota bacterium]
MLAVTLVVVGGVLFAGWAGRSLIAGKTKDVDYIHPRILMYHMVREPVAGATFNKLRVKPEQFEAQVRWLANEGWYFATMEELAERCHPSTSATPLPKKSVVLTFDDGYEDNLVNADPILERYGARATLYLVSDRFDRDWSTYKKAHHDSGELLREPKLSDKQIDTMVRSGRWELGGHTVTHANLKAIDDQQRQREIKDQRGVLQERFGQAISSFAYPFGIYGSEDVSLVREAGYRTAVTTEEGISADPKGESLELRRIKVSGKDSLTIFQRRLRTGVKR